MRFAIKAAVLAAAIVLSQSQGTNAQVFEPSSPMVTSGPSFGGSSMTAMAGPTLPYSYYVALPSPARIYVPYGPSDTFPYYGSPYGQPYDRWSWSHLAGRPASLTRYFYPPVR